MFNFNINISPILKVKGEKLNHKFKATLFLPEENLNGEIEANLTFTNVGGRIIVKGKIASIIPLQCSRCLDTFLYNINTKVVEEFIPQHLLSKKEYTARDSKELSLFTYDENNIINLKEMIRQNIILNIPIKPLCKYDCQGICICCGKNKNLFSCNCQEEETDTRWAALKHFKIGG